MKKMFGGPVMSLSAIVKNLMIEQGNSNQNHYADNLVRAKWTFKDLLKDTIYSVKYKVVTLDPADNSIIIPSDCSQLYSISVENHCGQLVPLAANPDMNTIRLECPVKKCSCQSCKGNGTLCDALDAIQVVFEDVDINGYPFTKKTWIQKCDDGVIRKVIELPYPTLPYPIGRAPDVTIKTEYETLCNLEVTSTGCIVPTEANHRLLMQYCGCYIPFWQSSACLAVNAINSMDPLSPAMNMIDINGQGLDATWIREYWCEAGLFPQSNFGYWNWDALGGQKIILKMVRATKFILCYRTNGEGCDGEEILVPEDALDAMQFGIVWRQRAFSPAFADREKESAFTVYTRHKDLYGKLLRPVSPEVLASLQQITPLW